MTKKIHTRTKRKFNLTSSFGHKNFFSGIIKKKGAKTFPTEEKAKDYATKQGLKAESFTIVPSKRNKKFKITLV